MRCTGRWSSRIVSHRPFASLEDFLARSGAQPLYAEAVNLVKAGALDGLGYAKAMLTMLEQVPWHGRHTSQMSLMFSAQLSGLAEPTPHERAAWERDTLGVLVGVHPLQLVAEELSRHDVTRSDQLSACADREVTVAGVRLAGHRFSSRREESMLLVDMEDEAGVYQALWSGAALQQHRALLSQRGRC